MASSPRLGVDGENPTGALGLYKASDSRVPHREWRTKPFPAGIGATPRDAVPEAFLAGGRPDDDRTAAAARLRPIDLAAEIEPSSSSSRT